MPRNEREKSRRCECGGSLEVIGACPTSHVDHCSKCNECTLDIHTGDFSARVPLALFFKTRLELRNGHPVDNVMQAATKLHEALMQNQQPIELIGMLYGVKDPEHFEALQALALAGLTEVEFDRLMGDGVALSKLTTSLPNSPYSQVQFETPFDEFGRNNDRRQDRDQSPNLDFDI